MMVDEPPSSSNTHGSAGTEPATPRDDPEKGRQRSDTMDTEKRELENVIGQQSLNSTMNMPPASESSDGVASEVDMDAEKASATRNPVIN